MPVPAHRRVGDRSRSPGGRRSSLAAVALIAAGVSACSPPDEPLPVAPSSKAGVVTTPGPVREPFFAEGLRLPRTVSAAASGLRDGEHVIGVVAGGKARAYRVGAMRIPTRHVINDVVGGVPITTTFCDLSRCIRGFAGEPGRPPLNVWQAGLLDNRMLLKVDGVAYSQETGDIVEQDPGRSAVPFPLVAYPLTLATWKEWKSLHPDTDVYAGDDIRR